ncbi:hypothetical protein N7523_006178 [Penicillium sp. IBT 18751x]|nr:hypothetical protein N7523_006178 [Penicillium sp. IBT 18751x]
MAESLAGRASLFLVVLDDPDHFPAAFPGLHDDGVDLICVCPIDGESASASARHHGVGGDENGHGNRHDDSGDEAGSGCASREIQVYQRIE